MGWRTVVVSKNCKLSYKNDYLVIRSEKLETVHLSEINIIIIENGMVSITSYLLNELVNKKIKLIICDEKHNPSGEVVPYYGAFDTSKKILKQINWDKNKKDILWKNIVKFKILNQAKILKEFNIEGYNKLYEFADEVKDGDITNREGHAAKVYFNLLFGKNFVRGLNDDVNIALDYGYSILLSMFNKDIVSKGYITQIGINHKSQFNFFNLSCDFMEPFRPLIDEVVYNNMGKIFDNTIKYKLVNVLNRKIELERKEQYVGNAISIFNKKAIDFLEIDGELKIVNYEL